MKTSKGSSQKVVLNSLFLKVLMFLSFEILDKELQHLMRKRALLASHTEHLFFHFSLGLGYPTPEHAIRQKVSIAIMIKKVRHPNVLRCFH